MSRLSSLSTMLALYSSILLSVALPVDGVCPSIVKFDFNWGKAADLPYDGTFCYSDSAGDMYLSKIKTFNPRPVPGMNKFKHPTFSQDGKWILVIYNW